MPHESSEEEYEKRHAAPQVDVASRQYLQNDWCLTTSMNVNVAFGQSSSGRLKTESLGVLKSVPTYKRKIVTLDGEQRSAVCVEAHNPAEQEAELYWLDPERFPGFQHSSQYVFEQQELDKADSPPKLQGKVAILSLSLY